LPDERPFLGVLPGLFFKHFVVTFDYPAGELRIDGFVDDPRREPSMAYPFGFGIAESLQTPIVITQVLAGSSAEEEGIAVGDVLVEIGGHAMANLDAYSRSWTMVGFEEGQTVSATLTHEDVEYEVELEARDLLTDPVLGE
jgi:S1-C subfamily serine protease